MNNNYKFTLDDFDGRIIGVRVAKIESLIISPNPLESKRIIKRMINELVKDNIKYVTIRFPSNENEKIFLLEDNDFNLIDAGVKLEINLSKEKGLLSNKIREAKENDSNKILLIVRGLYKNTRYFNDPFTRKYADDIYYKWMENSLNKTVADMVLVYEDMGVEGFLTLKKVSNNEYRIPLVGVLQKSQGRGIGKSIILGAIELCKDRGVKKMTIETQLNNIAAIRTYVSCGFKPTDSYFTFGRQI